MKRNLLQSASILFVAFTFLIPCYNAEAATIAGAGIEVDGAYVGGFAITWDNESREDLVGQLSRRSITFERDYKIPVDPKDPDVALLQGKILLLSNIRGDRETMATVTDLKLVKRDGKWFVDENSLKAALKTSQEE